MRGNNSGKIMVSCMAIFLLLALFYSHVFISTHIHHDCSGEGCPVCAEIRIAEAIVQQIGSALHTVMYLVAFVSITIGSISIANQVTLFHTPVEMKVRMND